MSPTNVPTSTIDDDPAAVRQVAQQDRVRDAEADPDRPSIVTETPGRAARGAALHAGTSRNTSGTQHTNASSTGRRVAGLGGDEQPGERR